jgi:hypothetical protein
MDLFLYYSLSVNIPVFHYCLHVQHLIHILVLHSQLHPHISVSISLSLLLVDLLCVGSCRLVITCFLYLILFLLLDPLCYSPL